MLLAGTHTHSRGLLSGGAVCTLGEGLCYVPDKPSCCQPGPGPQGQAYGYCIVDVRFSQVVNGACPTNYPKPGCCHLE